MKLSHYDLCNLYNCVSIALVKAIKPTSNVVRELEELQQRIEKEIDRIDRRPKKVA